MESLKEWATVVKALEDGTQTVLLRKGGILETSSGFKVKSKEFLLYPTFEHQNKENLRPQHHKYLQQIKQDKIEQGYNKISSLAQVIDEADIMDNDIIENLSKLHIWSKEYIKTRVNWMPQKPLKVIFLKVYKIDAIKIPIIPQYQGCKSWIDIDSDVGDKKAVLNKEELGTKLLEFEEIIN